tara:strand:+ start:803 stop:3235 length:2433 start_codon:yes stop_codon:yes gene_type:complete
MAFRKVQIAPGIKRDSTSYAAGNSWYDCNNIRFRGGVAESISGWEPDSLYELNGVGRSCFSSRDYSGNLYQFVGTNWKFYVIVGSKAFDITSLSADDNFTDKFSIVSGSPFVKVNILDHGLKVNDWINFVSVASDPLDGVFGLLTAALMTQVRGFQITEVDGLDNFYIYIEDEVTGLAVNSSATSLLPVGGLVHFRSRTPTGVNAEVTGAGWGSGDWGGNSPLRGWGLPSTDLADEVVVDSLRRVYIDNYGEDVMFANSGGPIYYWDTSVNTINGVPGSSGTFSLADVAIPINSTEVSGASNPPTIVDSFLISKRDGSCIAFGCNDLGGTSENSLLVRWSDQNNPFDWTPTPTNTSGGQVLRMGSRIMGGVSTKDEVVVFTDAALYSMRFVGPPNIFSFSLISKNVKILSHKCAVDAASSVYFMGNDGFYVYSGGGIRDVDCPISKYIFDDINMGQAEKSFAAVNAKFSEIMWFYPSSSGISSSSFEPDRFVCFNYEDKVWSFGNLDMSPISYTGSLQTDKNNRTAWIDSVNTQYPMSSYIYKFDQNPGKSGDRSMPILEKTRVMMHDFGTTAQGANIESYVESGYVELSEGDELSFYSQIIPDVMMFNSSGASAVTFTIKGKYYPGDAVSTSEGSVTANFAGPASSSAIPVVTEYTVGSIITDIGTPTDINFINVGAGISSLSFQASTSIGLPGLNSLILLQGLRSGVFNGISFDDLNNQTFPMIGIPDGPAISIDISPLVTGPNFAQVYGGTFTAQPPIAAGGSDAYVRAMHIRGRARSASIRVDSSNSRAQWRLGDVRIAVRPDGSR